MGGKKKIHLFFSLPAPKLREEKERTAGIEGAVECGQLAYLRNLSLQDLEVQSYLQGWVDGKGWKRRLRASAIGERKS